MTDAADHLAAARHHTLTAGTARVVWVKEQSWSFPTGPADPRARPHGPVRRAALGVGTTTAKLLGKAVYRLMTRGRDVDRNPLRRLTAEGFVDLTRRRSMIDHGHFAVVQLDTEQWEGRSGRARATLPAEPTRPGTPLWLIDLLGGITRVEEQGLDDIDGAPWRHFTVATDLAAASAATPHGIPTPQRGRFEELRDLPVEVWTDDTDLRRISYSAEHATYTVTLSDIDVEIDHLDWSRLPTFRSPDEARG